MGTCFLLPQSQTSELMQFEVIPLGAVGRSPFMGLHLGDDAAKNLPAERVYETDGVSSVRPLLLIFHSWAVKRASSRAGNPPHVSAF